MSYASLLSMDGVDPRLTDTSHTYITVTKEDGVRKRISFPSDDYYWWCNIPFLERHGIVTWLDLCNWVNEHNLARSVFVPAALRTKVLDSDGILVPHNVHGSTSIIRVHTIDEDDFSGGFVLCNSTHDSGQLRAFDVFFDYSVEVYVTKVVGGLQGLPNFLSSTNAYNFTPILKFLGGKKKDQFYFGLELEFSSRISPAEFQYIVTQVEPKQEPFFYFKSDSSVYSSFEYTGELVTFPCTPSYLRTSFRKLFRKLEVLAQERGVTLDSIIDITARPSNGLHIHINKESFSRYSTKSTLWKNKFVSIWNQWDTKNQKFFSKLSRRGDAFFGNAYCSPHKNLTHRTTAFRLKVGGTTRTHGERYASCRETNPTVEVRIFQGIFDLKHILYCINLTVAMHQYSEQMPISDLGKRFKESFLDWLKKQPNFNDVKEVIL